MTTSTATHLPDLRTACSACNLRELCLPVGLSSPDLERLDSLVAQRRQLGRGEDLFRAGDRFTSVYAVRTGFFKTGLTLEDGREQVTGFQMTGELLGLDGISTDAHTVTATALDKSQGCLRPLTPSYASHQNSGVTHRLRPTVKNNKPYKR